MTNKFSLITDPDLKEYLLGPIEVDIKKITLHDVLKKMNLIEDFSVPSGNRKASNTEIKNLIKQNGLNFIEQEDFMINKKIGKVTLDLLPLTIDEMLDKETESGYKIRYFHTWSIGGFKLCIMRGIYYGTPPIAIFLPLSFSRENSLYNMYLTP